MSALLMDSRGTTDVVRSEWVKLTSTRSLALCTVLAVVLSTAVTSLIAVAMASRESFCAAEGASCKNASLLPDATIATAGVLGDGIPGVGLTILMLLGASVLLIELRHRTIATTFMATPQRWRVLWSKAAVVVSTVFVVALVATVVSGLAFEALGGLAARRVDGLSAESLGIALRTAVVVAAAAAAALAIAAISRNLVVTVAAVVLWPTVVEVLVPSLVPELAGRIAGWMPFANARAFVGLDDGSLPPWGQTGSGLYFVLVCAALMAVATLVLNRADVRSR